MKILSIYGGPRKNGNTVKVLNWVEDEIESQGHEVNRIDLRNCKIEGCLSCYKCAEKEGFGECVQTNDDGNTILRQMSDADVILFSSPLYCYSFTSKIHALFERSISLVKDPMSPHHRTGVQEKIGSFIMTCAGPYENNADLVGPNFKRACEIMLMNRREELIITDCTVPEALGDEVKEKAISFAHELVHR